MCSPSAEALRFPCESPGRLGRIGRIINRAADYRIDVATGRGGAPGNKEVMDKYFGKYKTANFGVGGDITQGVLWGMKNGEAEGFQPKAIMLMIGTNNTGGNTAPEIAEGIGAIVMEMRKDFPSAKILLLAIFPRGNPGDQVRQTIADCNRMLALAPERVRRDLMGGAGEVPDATAIRALIKESAAS